MSELKTTVQVRLYPTPEQAAILRAHCQEYISTVNVLVAALDSDVLPDGGKGTRTKDFTAALPSAVKNQALRDARSVWKRSCALRVIPSCASPSASGTIRTGAWKTRGLCCPSPRTARFGRSASGVLVWR